MTSLEFLTKLKEELVKYALDCGDDDSESAIAELIALLRGASDAPPDQQKQG